MCEEEKEKMNEEQVESTTAPEAVAEEATSPAWLALQKDNEQLLSRLQRLQADFDNYRKRVVNEKKEWTTQSVCDVVREMLPVIDSLERAKEAAGSLESLTEGVDLVYRQLLSALAKHDVEVINACGSEFDPKLHHAIMQVECDEVENTVVEELQKGYKVKERVVRPSMVKVAK